MYLSRSSNMEVVGEATKSLSFEAEGDQRGLVPYPGEEPGYQEGNDNRYG